MSPDGSPKPRSAEEERERTLALIEELEAQEHKSSMEAASRNSQAVLEELRRRIEDPNWPTPIPKGG